MQRVIVSRNSIDVVDAPQPVPGPGEVLVHAVVTGVCGSDTHAAHGRHPFITLPYAPGHEVVGVVQQVANDVVGISRGQRVTVEPDLPCWSCKQCRAGRQNLCENLGFFGCGHPQGGMAELFTIPANRLHVVPDDLNFRAAALIEPLSTPVHAVRLSGDVAGRTIAILGAGTIGLLLLSVVKAHNAQRVVVTDLLPAKRQRALDLGADAVIDSAAADVVGEVRDALGESADIVFDCVAIQNTVDQAISMADKGGTVVIVGVPARDVTIPLALVQDHQIRIQGSATYLPEDYDESIALLQHGAIDIDAIITSEHPMSDVGNAFARSSAGADIKVLVVIDPEQFQKHVM